MVCSLSGQDKAMPCSADWLSEEVRWTYLLRPAGKDVVLAI